VSGTPPFIAACRAGAWPTPPLTTLPMMTSSMSPASMPARSTAARIAMPPQLRRAQRREPAQKRPMGVRAPLTITAVRRGSVMCSPRSSLPAAVGAPADRSGRE
jgi:hypothetical protein